MDANEALVLSLGQLNNYFERSIQLKVATTIFTTSEITKRKGFSYRR